MEGQLTIRTVCVEVAWMTMCELSRLLVGPLGLRVALRGPVLQKSKDGGRWAMRPLQSKQRAPEHALCTMDMSFSVDAN